MAILVSINYKEKQADIIALDNGIFAIGSWISVLLPGIKRMEISDNELSIMREDGTELNETNPVCILIGNKLKEVDDEKFLVEKYDISIHSREQLKLDCQKKQILFISPQILF